MPRVANGRITTANNHIPISISRQMRQRKTGAISHANGRVTIEREGGGLNSCAIVNEAGRSIHIDVADYIERSRGAYIPEEAIGPVELEITAHSHGAIIMDGSMAIEVHAGGDLEASPRCYDNLAAVVVEVEVAIDYQRAAYDQNGVLPQVQVTNRHGLRSRYAASLAVRHDRIAWIEGVTAVAGRRWRCRWWTLRHGNAQQQREE